MSLNGYYNRFNSNKKYTKSLFLAGKGLQSAELNEIQDYASHALRGIGDALFSDGDIISGCTCIVDIDTGVTTVEAGKIYLQGLVREVHEGNFTIPVNVSVRIGVYFQEQTITELEDSELRDPAVGTRNYQETGSGRLQYTMTWGYLGEGAASDATLGEFYTIYNVENGVLVQKAPAPQMDSVNTALARYDNESNGSYVVRGMNVNCLGATDGAQVFSVGEGKAHVDGYEVELPHSVRSRFLDDYDLQTVRSDPYVFDPNGLGVMTVALNYAPLCEVLSVDITAQRTINLTHGAFSGALDPIPSTAVESIVQVKQGATVYVAGTDYKLTAGQVDWSLGGGEPAPGSTYEITYRYRNQITPTNITDTGFDIEGAVIGSTVLISYTWKMPRYDLITIDMDGIVRRIKGLAHPWSPSVPKAPSGQLVLAQIFQEWTTNTKPTVSNNAIRVVQMADIEGMKDLINNLYYLVSQERLKTNANASDPSAKKGIFVDPFFDDDMRDQGVEQTGAIVDGKLVLPISSTVQDFAKDEAVYMLPYVVEPVVIQEMQTGSMKINPYNAFDPIPADLKITLSVDRWTEIETQWLSPVTNIYYTRLWMRGGSATTTEQLVSSAKKNLEYMRQITQLFQVDGLRAGEHISRVSFDGVDITDQIQPQQEEVE